MASSKDDKNTAANRIIHQRLLNQQISHQEFDSPEEVVRWMGAVQAQDFLYSRWALGLRLPNANAMDIEQSIADGSIIRTWSMRGTIHYVLPTDAGWMLQLLSKRVIKSHRSVYKEAGIDDEIVSKGKKILTESLQGNRLTRKEIYASLEKEGIAATVKTPVGSRGSHLIRRLAMEGVLCFGPRKGKQETFVLLEEWASNPRKLEKAESLAELTMRYFRSHGPATEYDFAWWSGLTVTKARRAIDMVYSQLQEEQVNDTTYWITESANNTQKNSHSVHLLPFLDEYTVGYKDRSMLLESEVSKQIYEDNNQGILWPVIVVDGQVVGTWKRTLNKKNTEIDSTLYVDLTASESEALHKEVERYGRFNERGVKLL